MCPAQGNREQSGERTPLYFFSIASERKDSPPVKAWVIDAQRFFVIDDNDKGHLIQHFSCSRELTEHVDIRDLTAHQCHEEETFLHALGRAILLLLHRTAPTLTRYA